MDTPASGLALIGIKTVTASITVPSMAFSILTAVHRALLPLFVPKILVVASHCFKHWSSDTERLQLRTKKVYIGFILFSVSIRIFSYVIRDLVEMIVEFLKFVFLCCC